VALWLRGIRELNLDLFVRRAGVTVRRRASAGSWFAVFWYPGDCNRAKPPATCQCRRIRPAQSPIRRRWDHLARKNDGGWRWKPVAKVPFRVAGHELHLAIPRESLGILRGQTGLTLDFRWADNLQHPGYVMDFYTGGDVAPEGRFRYRYSAE
jgi:hypothetical protein